MAHGVLFDKVKLDGVVAFAMSNEPGNSHGYLMYDADRGMLVFRSYAIQGHLAVAGRPANVDSGEKIEGSSPQSWIDYFKNEKFKTVDFKEELILALGGRTGIGTELIATAKLPPGKAKALEGHVSIIVIGNINPPYMQTHYDLPFTGNLSTIRYERLVPFSLKGVWMIDNRSGDVISTSDKLKL